MVRKRSPDIEPGHDELDLLLAMLSDKYVNHGLDKILKEVQIIRIEAPENYGEYPGMRVYSGQWVGARIADEPDEDGDFVDMFAKSCLLEIYVMQNQEVKYANKIYKGTRILTLIRDILIRTFSEQDDYPFQADEKIKNEITDIQMDLISIDTENYVSEYLGQMDAIALLIGIVISYEKKRL